MVEVYVGDAKWKVFYPPLAVCRDAGVGVMRRLVMEGVLVVDGRLVDVDRWS